MFVIVQDGAAHNQTWHCKNDGGMKLCLICRNLFTEDSAITTFDGTRLLKCNLSRTSELDIATDADIIGALHRLKAHKATDSNVVFGRRSMAIGFRIERYNLCLDPDIDAKPISWFMHDWMHCFLASGIFQLVLHLLLEALILSGVGHIYAMVGGFLRQYNWPKRVQSSISTDGIARLFDHDQRAKNRKADHFRCQASEALSMYPVICIMMMNMRTLFAACDNEIKAFIALCDLLDLFIALPRGLVTPGLLQRRIDAFMECFLAAWGWEYMFPKMHWTLHFAQHLLRFGVLLGCFVHERKHRLIKRYAEDIHNTTKFEHSLMSELLCHQFSRMSAQSAFAFSVGLVDPMQTITKGNMFNILVNDFGTNVEFKASRGSRFSEFGICHKHDVVFVKDDGPRGIACGQVWAHLSVGGVPTTIISLWSLAADNSFFMDWTCAHNPVYVETELIIDVAIWTRQTASVVRTIVPPSVSLLR